MSSSERRSRTRVMVVEHSETSARIITHALRNDRLEIQRIPHGTVSECVKNWKPQLIILGDDLDGVDGIELCATIRLSSYAPIVIVTECEAAGHHIRAYNSGADDVVLRPFSNPLFLARMLSQLRRSYRYSVPVQHTLLPRSAVPAHATPHPVVAAFAPNSQQKMTSWSICEGCGYKGPVAHFENRDEHGRILHACPLCREAAIVPYATI